MGRRENLPGLSSQRRGIQKGGRDLTHRGYRQKGQQHRYSEKQVKNARTESTKSKKAGKRMRKTKQQDTNLAGTEGGVGIRSKGKRTGLEISGTVVEYKDDDVP